MLNSAVSIIFRDFLFSGLARVVFLVVLMIPLINLVKKQETTMVNSPGTVMVELRWPDESKSDVDLWIKAPGERPVGYSNKAGVHFNLLRDDLGYDKDPMKMNYENAYSRGIPEGEIVVNLHLYDKNDDGPIHCTVVVSTQVAKFPTKVIAKKEVDLTFDGEELTVFRFKLDQDGNLVPGSLHDIPISIRSMQ